MFSTRLAPKTRPPQKPRRRNRDSCARPPPLVLRPWALVRAWPVAASLPSVPEQAIAGVANSWQADVGYIGLAGPVYRNSRELEEPVVREKKASRTQHLRHVRERERLLENVVVDQNV